MLLHEKRKTLKQHEKTKKKQSLLTVQENSKYKCNVTYYSNANTYLFRTVFKKKSTFIYIML